MTPGERNFIIQAAGLLPVLCVLGGCSFAPQYQRPAVMTPTTYKELAPPSPEATNLWKIVQPSDAVVRGKWWELFRNPELNTLEEKVAVSNQNVAAAFANYLTARALVKEAQSQYYPALTANPTVTRSRQPSIGRQTGLSTGGATLTDYSLPLDTAWQLDLWGRIRNTVKANARETQAAIADLENTRLTAQAELAADFFQLHAQDSLAQLYADTVRAYRESFDLTKIRLETGIASDEDVAQAETQLRTAEAQATNLGILRSQLEHAIALLIGQPASTFSIPEEPLSASPPAIPFGVPSQLLERRPDVAAAERRVAAANARIGVAKAAYYPTLTLSAAGGFQSSVISSLLNWSSRVWSVGSGLAETLFDAGQRQATVAQFQADYDLTVASYRQAVLAAFQQQEAAVHASERNLTLATDRYKLGIDSYLNVITAQTTHLVNRQNLVSLRRQQMTATVQLIAAIGGGWDASPMSAGCP